MNSEMKADVKKIALCILGVIIIGFGFALMASSNLGLDCLDSFNEALSHFVGRDFSVIANVTEIIMILAAYILDKKNIGLGTILYMLIIDLPLEFFQNMLPTGGSIYVSILYSFAGIVFLAFGIELTIHTGLGTIAYEAFIYGLEKKIERSFVFTKYLVDSILLVFVLMLGSKIEFGTMMYLVLCPWIMEFMAKLIRKYIRI